jgi:hypothetical protein
VAGVLPAEMTESKRPLKVMFSGPAGTNRCGMKSPLPNA